MFNELSRVPHAPITFLIPILKKFHYQNPSLRYRLILFILLPEGLFFISLCCFPEHPPPESVFYVILIMFTIFKQHAECETKLINNYTFKMTLFFCSSDLG